MVYSLNQSDFDKPKQGAEFTYFSEEEWNSYPFVSDEDTKVSGSEIRIVSSCGYFGNGYCGHQLAEDNT